MIVIHGHIQYKVYRNKLTHIKEYAKRLYIKNLVNDNKHDTSSLWKIINKIFHLKNNIPNKMYASTSESAQGSQAISNLFNKYFIEIGVNLASTIETPAIIDGKFNATSLIQSSCNQARSQKFAMGGAILVVWGRSSQRSKILHFFGYFD